MAIKIKKKKNLKSGSYRSNQKNIRNFISKLHLKNFKSFFGPLGSNEIEIKLAPKITLLFGKNSAGKSSLLQAIKLIQQSYDNDGDLVLNPTKSYPGGLYFPSYKDLVSKKETMRSISLGLTANEIDNRAKVPNPNNVGKKEDSKTIIKKFSASNNKINCAEVDFYSFSDDKEKFISIKNNPFYFKDLIGDYVKSEILYFENKYQWKELFKYTYMYKKKLIPYLDRCIDFANKWEKLMSVKNKSEKVENEIDKIFQQSIRLGEFSPIHFRFNSNKRIKEYKKYLSNMTNDFNNFIKYISNDVKKNKKFLFKNNQTFSAGEIGEILASRNKDLEEHDRKKLLESSASNATLADFLCHTVSMLCGAKYPNSSTFNPNNHPSELQKTLDPRKMISFCNEIVSSAIKSIRIFHGQKALPTEYENISAYEENFVGYNYEFLHKVIESNKKEINKWLKHFGYDFKIETESGGPTSVTLIQHKKENFKINYKHGGLGAENVLPVIAQSVSANNKILVFEEPERRAHPHLQVKLADLFVECSKKNQFIIETHSENLLLGILKNIRDGKISYKDVQVSYIYIDKGQSKIDELNLNEKGNFESNWRDGFFTERLDLI